MEKSPFYDKITKKYKSQWGYNAIALSQFSSLQPLPTGFKQFSCLSLPILFLGQTLALLLRLECSGMISPHPPPPSFQQLSGLSFPIEMGFHHIGQAGLELLTSSNPPILASQSARITDMSHQPWAHLTFSTIIGFTLKFFRQRSPKQGISTWCGISKGLLSAAKHGRRQKAIAIWKKFKVGSTQYEFPTSMLGVLSGEDALNPPEQPLSDLQQRGCNQPVKRFP
ncbi:hypothetical protein AAY473_016461 [Plecturocebus cupreus]